MQIKKVIKFHLCNQLKRIGLVLLVMYSILLVTSKFSNDVWVFLVALWSFMSLPIMFFVSIGYFGVDFRYFVQGGITRRFLFKIELLTLLIMGIIGAIGVLYLFYFNTSLIERYHIFDLGQYHVGIYVLCYVGIVVSVRLGALVLGLILNKLLPNGKGLAIIGFSGGIFCVRFLWLIFGMDNIGLINTVGAFYQNYLPFVIVFQVIVLAIIFKQLLACHQSQKIV